MTDRRMIDGHPFVRYAPEPVSSEAGLARGRERFAAMDRRRTVRAFSGRPVPREMIELAIRTASTAPSGAHQQAWTFAAVSAPSIKSKIRVAAEAEEQRNYSGGRMPSAWRRAIARLGTDEVKPYLEIAPWVVVLFAQIHGVGPEGERIKHYYPRESLGIAAGMFIAAVHEMGLATLTHTPSPMNFLSEVLGRPSNETAFLLCPVGYPADDVWVPDIERKPLDDISVWFEGE